MCSSVRCCSTSPQAAVPARLLAAAGFRVCAWFAFVCSRVAAPNITCARRAGTPITYIAIPTSIYPMVCFSLLVALRYVLC
jgi:hypothetical protein